LGGLKRLGSLAVGVEVWLRNSGGDVHGAGATIYGLKATLIGNPPTKTLECGSAKIVGTALEKILLESGGVRLCRTIL